MIATLTLNPSLDYHVLTEDFCLNKTNRAKEAYITAGGKGINISKVLSFLSIENTAYGFLAGFTGQKLLSDLKSENIKSDFVMCQEGETRINVKLDEYDGTEINATGPIIKPNEITALLDKLDSLSENDYICISGSVPASIGSGFYKNLVEKLSKKGVKCIVDLSTKELLDICPLHPFLVKPNKDELYSMFETSENDYSVKELAYKLKELGAVNVLVSLGKDGAVLIDNKGDYFEEAAKSGIVISSVGSGDSMIAGFLGAYINKWSSPECLKYAVACGSATAFKKGLCDKADIEKIYAGN